MGAVDRTVGLRGYASAAPALTRGLTDADVRARRGVALHLLWAGGNNERVTPERLDLTTFLDWSSQDSVEARSASFL